MRGDWDWSDPIELAGGCLGIVLVFALNLLMLAAVVYVIATVVKEVFG